MDRDGLDLLEPITSSIFLSILSFSLSLSFSRSRILLHNSFFRGHKKDIYLEQISLCECIHIWYTSIQFLQFLPVKYLQRVDRVTSYISLRDVLLHEKYF